MTTTSPAGLAAGRWTADPACSTATFTVSSLGRTVTGTVPITEGIVEVDGAGLPRQSPARSTSPPSTPATPAGTRISASRSSWT